MGKIIYSEKENQDKILKGVNELANTVKITMGAAGQNVIIHNTFLLPHVTKDGVTVAKNIAFDDPVKDSGAQLVKQAAIKTLEGAGDGTTTAIVLSQKLISRGAELINMGCRPGDLAKGMIMAAEGVLKNVKEMATPVKDIETVRRIATVSANNDEAIGAIIAEAVDAIGFHGLIDVQESKGNETTIRIMEGIEIDRGYISPAFAAGNPKMECVLHNPYILLYQNKIGNIADIAPLLNKLIQESRPLLIVAEEVDGDALQTLLLNKQRGSLSCCVVRAPEFGDQRLEAMEDLAVVTGGTYIAEEKSIKLTTAGIQHLGQAQKVVVARDRCVIIGGAGTREAIAERAERTRTLAATTDHEIMKAKYEKRAASLSSGVAIISVGGATEAEMKERRDRVDDAKCATKAAIEEGFVAGGGACFLVASGIAPEGVKSKGVMEGFALLIDAVQQPFRQILENAHINPDDHINEVEGKGYPYGYNVKTEKVENMVEAGIIDPAKVLRVALQNAVSVATVILSAGATIVETQSNQQ